MAIPIEAYLAVGLFGGSGSDSEGHYRFERIPLLLAPSRANEALAGKAVWSDSPRGWFANASSDWEALGRWLPVILAPYYFVATSTISWMTTRSELS